MKKQVEYVKVIGDVSIGARCVLQLSSGQQVQTSRVIALDDRTIETKNTIYIKYSNIKTEEQMINEYVNRDAINSLKQQSIQQPNRLKEEMFRSANPETSIPNQNYQQPYNQQQYNQYQQPQYQQQPQQPYNQQQYNQYQQPYGQPHNGQPHNPYEQQSMPQPRVNDPNQYFEDEPKRPTNLNEATVEERLKAAKGLKIIGSELPDN